MKEYKKLPDKWADHLVSKPETGMGYWIATVKLSDGRIYQRVAIAGGYLTQIYGENGIPFEPDEIAEIIVTHDKWDFKKS